MEKEEDIKEQFDLIFDVVSKKLEQQVSSLGSMDTKASILLAAIGVIFAGYLQLLSSGSIVRFTYPIFVFTVLVSFILSGFYVFKSFMLKRDETWRNDPRPKTLLTAFSENSDKGVYWLKDQIIKNISSAYEINDALVLKKYENLHKAKKFLYIGVITLTLHILVSLLLC